MSETPMQLSREERLFRQHALWHAAKDARIAELEAALREAQPFIIPYAFGQDPDRENPAGPTQLYKRISRLLTKEGVKTDG